MWSAKIASRLAGGFQAHWAVNREERENSFISLVPSTLPNEAKPAYLQVVRVGNWTENIRGLSWCERWRRLEKKTANVLSSRHDFVWLHPLDENDDAKKTNKQLQQQQKTLKTKTGSGRAEQDL